MATNDSQPPPSYRAKQPNYPPSQKLPNYGSATNGVPIDAGTGAPNPSDRFAYVSKPIYHDLWATILFLIHFVVYIVLSGIGIQHLSVNGFTPSNSTTNGTTTPPSDKSPPPLPSINFFSQVI